MSYITDRSRIEICPNPGLTVTWCGWQRCDANHQVGPTFYKDYAITFVLDGCGSYTLREKTWQITPGTGFVIVPGEHVSYAADSRTPWEYIFATFHGADVPTLLASVGISAESPVFAFDNNAEMRDLLERMRQASKSSAHLGYDVVGFFYRAIALIAHRYMERYPTLNPAERYVSKALAYMEANYPYNICVQDVVAYVGVERSWFYRLFKEQTGLSPQQWLLQLRLKRAVFLLTGTKLPLTEIAYSSGFYDLPHFTKVFRRKYGCAPSEYRQLQQALAHKAPENDAESGAGSQI